MHASLHQIQNTGASHIWSNPVGTIQSWQETHHLACYLMDYIFVFFSYFIREEKRFWAQFCGS